MYKSQGFVGRCFTVKRGTVTVKKRYPLLVLLQGCHKKGQIYIPWKKIIKHVVIDDNMCKAFCLCIKHE